MNKKRIGILGLSLVALGTAMASLSGCATMFGESSDEVRFDSEPQGADLYIDGKLVGKTPITVTLPRRTETTTARATKAGYGSKSMNLAKSLTPASFLNIFFITTTFGATSWGIDAASGKLLKYSPDGYVIDLEEKKAKGQTVTSLEYVVTNHDQLQRELVQGKGEYTSGLCLTYGFQGEACDALYQRLQLKQSELLAQPDSLAWYRAMNAVASP